MYTQASVVTFLARTRPKHVDLPNEYLSNLMKKKSHLQCKPKLCQSSGKTDGHTRRHARNAGQVIKTNMNSILCETGELMYLCEALLQSRDHIIVDS